MAVAIKTFAGSLYTGGSLYTTVYTVPSGRCAKVLVSYITCSSGYFPAINMDGNVHVFQSYAEYTSLPGFRPGSMYVASSQILNTENLIYYLGPGQSFAIGSANYSYQTLQYSFCAVEEVQS